MEEIPVGVFDKKENWISLHHAAAAGDRGRVWELLEGEADIEAVDQDDYTPLHAVASNGHQEMVKYLVEQGAVVEAKTEHGVTSLHYAAQNGYFEITCYLVEQGAKVGVADQECGTPLHYAALNFHQNVMYYLLGERTKNYPLPAGSSGGAIPSGYHLGALAEQMAATPHHVGDAVSSTVGAVMPAHDKNFGPQLTVDCGIQFDASRLQR